MAKNLCITTKTVATGEVIIDIPEFNRLSRALHEYEKQSNTNALEEREFFLALIDFLEWYILFADKRLKGKSINREKVARNIFKLSVTSNAEYQRYLLHSLYAAQQYAIELQKQIKPSLINQYKDLAHIILADYEWLLANYSFYNMHSHTITITHGSRRTMTACDIIWGAKQLLFSENTPSMSQFDYRNTKPCTMFQVRQVVELLGRNLLGYSDVLKPNGEKALNCTQVAWKFLEQYEIVSPNIHLPLPASLVRKINMWANSFAHELFIYNCYIQFYALDCICELMQPLQTPVRCFNGQNRLSTLYGDFRIENYSQVKQDFDDYINTNQKTGRRISHPMNIQWFPNLDDVGAYIISL